MSANILRLSVLARPSIVYPLREVTAVPKTTGYTIQVKEVGYAFSNAGAAPVYLIGSCTFRTS